MNLKLINEDDVVRDKVVELLSQSKFSEADKLTREYVRKYLPEISSWSWDRLVKYITEVTGGLGYREDDLYDIDRIIEVGEFISWSRIVKNGYKVLEIGTGLGRTMYTILSKTRCSLYLSLDIDPVILAICLYYNPISIFQSVLDKAYICLCDAVRAIPRVNVKFNHIIHDGGPNPRRNPRLFSKHFIHELINHLEDDGTISIFAGRDSEWIEKIYNYLKELKVYSWVDKCDVTKLKVVRGIKSRS